MKIFNDHSIIKDEMLAILNGIETEIDSTLSNNNRAMQTLGVDRASGGWCELFYSNEAEELWNKQLKTTPDDQETLHHLAILHHARAFDLEFSDKSSKSDTDWSKAWKIWEQILKQDDFLERFSGSIVGIDIETFTKPFIEKIVAIHFAFAYSSNTIISRSKFHLQQATHTGVSNEILNKIRMEIYENITKDFPDEIWVGNFSDISMLNQACIKIKKIIDIDNECLPALFDIIRIQFRILEYLASKKHENKDDKKALRKILSELNNNANEWFPYFDLCLRNKDKLDYDLNDNIVSWYRFMGNIKIELKDWKNALHYIENTVQLNFDDETSKQDALEAIPIYHSVYARELSKKKSAIAKSECKKAELRKHHSSTSYFILSQAYQAISEIDLAIETCKKGISLSENENNKESSKIGENVLWRERLAEHLKSLEMHNVISIVQKYMEKKEFRKAIKILSEAIDNGCEDVYLFFFRCKCYMEVDWNNKARTDFQKVEELAKSKDEKQAAQNLRKQFDNIGTENYLKEALKAIKEKKYTIAVNRLNKIINIDTKDCFLYTLRCQCYMELDKSNKAEQDLKKAEKYAKTNEEKTAIKTLKKNLFIQAPDNYERNQIASDLIQQLDTNLPYGVTLKRANCIGKLETLLKSESKKWSKNSINKVAQVFMEDFKYNVDYYCYRD